MWFVYLCAGLGILFVIAMVVIFFLDTDSGIDTIPPSKRDEEPFCPHIWQLIDLDALNHSHWNDEGSVYTKAYVYQCIACNKKKTVLENMREEFEKLFVIENE